MLEVLTSQDFRNCCPSISFHTEINPNWVTYCSIYSRSSASFFGFRIAATLQPVIVLNLPVESDIPPPSEQYRWWNIPEKNVLMKTVSDRYLFGVGQLQSCCSLVFACVQEINHLDPAGNSRLTLVATIEQGKTCSLGVFITMRISG